MEKNWGGEASTPSMDIHLPELRTHSRVKTQHRMGEDTSGIHRSDLLVWDAEKGRLQQLSERMENAEEGWSLTPMMGCF